MANQDLDKFYPAASEEVAKLLGLTGEKNKPANAESVVMPDEVVPPGVSAVSDENADEQTLLADVAAITGKTPKVTELPGADLITAGGSKAKSLAAAVGKTLLAAAPYVAVFLVGLTVYYVWFADPSNRPQIFKSVERPAVDQATQKKAALLAYEQAQKSDYQSWIAQYYYAVNDASIVDMNVVANNGLTNFENYLLKINPKTNDVFKTGKTDAQNVLAGIDPTTGKPLADWQKDLVAQYFDSSTIATRVPGTVATLQTIITPRGPAVGAPQVAGQSTVVTPNPAVTPTPVPVPTQVQSPTPVVTPAPTPAPPAPVLPKVAPVTGPVTTSDCSENAYKINTSIPGRLEIPTIGVNVPIIWTTNTKNFDTDLKTGIVHYPCTPLPGDIGTSYISGHSSNYAWIKADYNKVFARLNDLPEGATFKITVVNASGKDVRLYYTVKRKQIYAADDQAQFTNTAESVVALSTCWPINTNQKRLVAYGSLSRVEQ
jgi:LPXTG-site transpeptidase (sortase) family protein